MGWAGLTDVALHERAAVVVLDEAHPALLGHHHLLAEALLLEVADCEIIRIGQKIFYSYIIFFFVHVKLKSN